MKKALLAVMAVCVASAAFAAEGGRALLNPRLMSRVSTEVAAQRGQPLRIHLLTAAAGGGLTEIYQWWGHSALIVENSQTGSQTAYDYGVFSVPENSLLFSFLKGRIHYLVVDSVFTDYHISTYLNANRWVVLQELNLESAARYRLAEYLKRNVSGEAAVYPYHFFRENCCTKLRDLIDDAVDGQLYRKLNRPAAGTFRSWCRPYLQKSFMADWTLQYLLGPSVDRPAKEWDRLFLPYELMSEVQNFSYVDSTGRTRPLTLHKTEHIPPSAARQWEKAGIPRDRAVLMGDPLRVKKGASATGWLGLCVGLAVGAVGAVLFLLGLRRKGFRIAAGVWTAAVSLLLFALSVVLTVLQFFSTMDVTFGNWNIVLINPVTMAVAFLLSVLFAANVGKSSLAYTLFWLILSAAALILLLLSQFGLCPQSNIMVLSAFFPFFLLMALSGCFKKHQPMDKPRKK